MYIRRQPHGSFSLFLRQFLTNRFICVLRYKLLRNLLILSLAIAVLLPGYEYLFVYPAYNELLIEETESEAVRYASYMVRTIDLENQFLTQDRLPEGLEKSLQPASREALKAVLKEIL